MRSTRIFLVTAFFLLLISFSCKKANAPADAATAATLYDYTDLDGCGWVIKTENEVLEPVNLGEFDIHLFDGKNIWIEYSLVNDAASICMVGPIIRIKAIWDR